MIEDLLLAQNGLLLFLHVPRQEEIESIVKIGLPAYLILSLDMEKHFHAIKPGLIA